MVTTAISATNPGVRQQVLEAVESPIEPVPTTLSYRLALLAVAMVMLLLPVLYIGLIGLTAWGTVEYTRFAISIAQGSEVRARGKSWLFLPTIAMAVAIFFMIKPLFAKKARAAAPRSLNPQDEPLLFEYIAILCKSVHAPAPKRICVSTDVNAFAAFQRGWSSLFRRSDLVLTLGLPLVRGLTLRELSGVLAHEFGHFSQGASMRLNFLIRAINLWFARVVYERDAWDERLANWTKGIDHRFSILLYVTGFFVWLTRRILWVFMMVGHAVSCLLMRQMEYNADLHEIRLAGSDAFAATSQQLRRLSLARELCSPQLQEFYTDGKLVDDLPHWFKLCRDNQPAELIEGIQQLSAAEKTGWLDTHPSDRDRIAFATKQACLSRIRSELPASALFQDIDSCSRAATRDFYQIQFGEQFQDQMLTSVDHLTDAQTQAQQIGQAYHFVFGTESGLPQSLDFQSAKMPPLDQKDAARQLAELRDSMEAGRNAYYQHRQQYQNFEQSFIEARKVLSLRQAGFALDSMAWPGLDVSSPDTLKMEVRSRYKRVAGLAGQMASYEVAFVNRVNASMCWLRGQPHTEESQIQGLLAGAEPALAAAQSLALCLPVVNELRIDFVSFLSVAQLAGEVERTNSQIEVYERLGYRIVESLCSLQELLQGVRYPFDHSSGHIDLKTYLLPKLPADKDPAPLLAITDGFMTLFAHTYFRTLGSLAWMVQQVEQLTDARSHHAAVIHVESPPSVVTAAAVTASSPAAVIGPSATSMGLPTRVMHSTLQTVVTDSGTLRRSLKRDYRTLIWLSVASGVVLACVGVLVLFVKLADYFTNSIGDSSIASQPASAILATQDAIHQQTPQAGPIHTLLTRPLLFELPAGQDFQYAVKIQPAAQRAQQAWWEGHCTLNASGEITTNNEIKSSGTGFVIGRDGWIATCAHIVHTSNEPEVSIAGRKYKASVKAVDTESDLAILKVEAGLLTPLTLAEVTEVALAQSIMIVGFPFTNSLGPDVKVSRGSVSGMVNSPERGSLIGLDRALNPGQSGGPVVDEFGLVVGVATAKLTGIEADSVGFATPISRLKQLIQQANLNIQLVNARSTNALSSQQIAAATTPSVCAITAHGKRQGIVATLNYQAVTKAMANVTFDRSPRQEGQFRISRLGSLLSDTDKTGALPMMVGGLSELLFEPLDPVHQLNWSHKRLISLRLQQSDAGPSSNLFAGGGSRFPMDPRGRATQSVQSLPAAEAYQFKLKEQRGKLLVYDKTYKLRTLDDENDPMLEITGTGIWTFDLGNHVSHSLEQILEVKNRHAAVQSIQVSYQLLGSQEIEQLHAERQRAADQQRQYREVPNSAEVRRLIEDIKQAGFEGGAAWGLLQKLSTIAVVPELRSEVLEVVRPHVFPRSQEESFMGRSTPNSVNAYCQWADISCEAEVLKLLAKETDAELGPVLRLLGSFKKHEHIPVLIKYFRNDLTRREAKAALVHYGSEIESELLSFISATTNAFALFDSFDLLGESAGTQKSIDAIDAMHFDRSTSRRWEVAKVKIQKRIDQR
ncbi:MAG: trypsin-like peptidase domain-containing protein [Pirellulaceae bacterium]|nr:trypsin-like peptidase domain-containing protein [Pirellulaceae bacterium]